MRIHWISLYGLHTLPDGTRFAQGASARLRMLIPGAELERRGHRVSYHKVPETETVNGQVIEGPFPEEIADRLHGDVVVFSKTANRVNERLGRLAKQRGMRMVFDICDNHFAGSPLSAHYRSMAALADTIATSTPTMADIIRTETGFTPRLVAEPYEGIRHPARFSPGGDALRLLWFGHQLGFDSLEGCLLRLNDFSRRHPVRLTVVTRLTEKVAQKLEIYRHLYGESLGLESLAWSPETTWAALAATDAAILPALANDKKAVKSPNRLVETLWAGRLPVAHAIAAYRDYADWAWVGDDLAQGLQWALDHADEIPERIATGQAWIAEHHAPSVIADQWEKVLEA